MGVGSQGNILTLEVGFQGLQFCFCCDDNRQTWIYRRLASLLLNWFRSYQAQKEQTGIFAPPPYKIWKEYGRTFKKIFLKISFKIIIKISSNATSCSTVHLVDRWPVTSPFLLDEWDEWCQECLVFLFFHAILKFSELIPRILVHYRHYVWYEHLDL